jgi:hypothetical protein
MPTDPPPDPGWRPRLTAGIFTCAALACAAIAVWCLVWAAWTETAIAVWGALLCAQGFALCRLTERLDRIESGRPAQHTLRDR